jgi:hypothetical protein
MAIAMIGAAGFHGDDSNATVSRAVIDATAGPFLLASLGSGALVATHDQKI